tara:strand:+ start:4015 stop:4200 length:186 start_codon:yes stop_codon:yes gene_type:complete
MALMTLPNAFGYQAKIVNIHTSKIQKTKKRFSSLIEGKNLKRSSTPLTISFSLKYFLEKAV